MTLIDGLTDKQIAQLLADELKQHPGVTIRFDAHTAYRLAALLQLALRHPKVGNDNREFVEQIINQVRQIGPVVSATFDLGFDATKDSPA